MTRTFEEIHAASNPVFKRLQHTMDIQDAGGEEENFLKEFKQKLDSKVKTREYLYQIKLLEERGDHPDKTLKDIEAEVEAEVDRLEYREEASIEDVESFMSTKKKDIARVKASLDQTLENLKHSTLGKVIKNYSSFREHASTTTRRNIVSDIEQIIREFKSVKDILVGKIKGISHEMSKISHTVTADTEAMFEDEYARIETGVDDPGEEVVTAESKI